MDEHTLEFGRCLPEREYFYLVRTEQFVADSSGNPVPGEQQPIETGF
jgi:hypothetical protein